MSFTLQNLEIPQGYSTIGNITLYRIGNTINQVMPNSSNSDFTKQLNSSNSDFTKQLNESKTLNKTPDNSFDEVPQPELLSRSYHDPPRYICPRCKKALSSYQEYKHNQQPRRCSFYYTEHRHTCHSSSHE